MGSPIVVEFFVVPGRMVGLWRRSDMERLQANLYLRDGKSWADFDKLGIYGSRLDMRPNGHTAVNLFGFEEERPTDSEELTEFRLGQDQATEPSELKAMKNLDGFIGECLTDVQQEQDAWVARAVASGKTGPMPRASEDQRRQGPIGRRVPGDGSCAERRHGDIRVGALHRRHGEYYDSVGERLVRRTTGTTAGMEAVSSITIDRHDCWPTWPRSTRGSRFGDEGAGQRLRRLDDVGTTDRGGSGMAPRGSYVAGWTTRVDGALLEL